MTSRRHFLFVAIAVLAVHALVLWRFGGAPPGPLLSDLVQLLLGLLVFVACLQSARRSRAFGRLFWRLAAFAVFLWCIGQTLDAYYGSFLNLPTDRFWYAFFF